MELQKPQDDPRTKTLETTERLPAPIPSISSSPHQQPTSQGNAGEPSDEGGEGVEQKGSELLASATAASGSTDSAAEAEVSGPVTDLQRKLLRAERFGTPVQLSEEEKRNSRSERFGTSFTSHGGKVTGELEEQKRKARAERFGLAGACTADEEAKKKARSERFGENPKPDTIEEEKKKAPKLDSIEEEKRKARALRFAPASRASSEANDKADSELKTAVAKT